MLYLFICPSIKCYEIWALRRDRKRPRDLLIFIRDLVLFYILLWCIDFRYDKGSLLWTYNGINLSDLWQSPCFYSLSHIAYRDYMTERKISPLCYLKWIPFWYDLLYFGLFHKWFLAYNYLSFPFVTSFLSLAFSITFAAVREVFS